MRNYDDLLELTRKKFLIASIVGFFTIISLSAVFLVLNRSLISDQQSYQTLNSFLKKQIFLMADITDFSQKFKGKQITLPNEIRFVELVKRLKAETKEFYSWINGNRLPKLQNFKVFLTSESIENKTYEFIEVAESFIDDTSNNKSSVNQNIGFLIKSSSSGLGKVLELISSRVSEAQEDSLDDLDLLGILLVLCCVGQFGIIWLLVYRPLFKAVSSQHEKITETMIQVESASKSKTNFLSNISHEIRTPMTIILGYIEMLRSHTLEGKERDDAIELVFRNGNHLLSLLDEILDISKIESGKIDYRIEKVETTQFLTDVYGLLSVKAAEKNIELIFFNRGKIPRFINSDQKRLKQILFNIIGNAIKFTAEGHVELIATFNKKSNKLIFTINDTGMGISKKNQKRLFKPFEQGDDSVSRVYGGTGLGLMISRAISRGLGGNLKIIETRENVGTTFEIKVDVGIIDGVEYISSLDQKSSALNEEVEELEIDLTGKRVLIVDDAKENVRLFYAYLKEVGAESQMAYGGQEAVDKFKAGSFDVVLLDLQMPEIDGYQAIRMMKEFNPEIPIIALTAHAMDEERVRTKKAGFSDHITKPVTSKDLIRGVHNNIM
jgi:signal transduction histidine kinase/AmiR/NasT family two-component response regulator